MEQETKYPEPTVGVVIYNEKSEILFVQMDKWGKYWNIPGGHIEIGEKYEDTVKREVKEETGLEVSEIEYLGWQEAIFPKGFSKKKHFIFLDFKARLIGGKETKSDEMTEYKWLKPEDALKKLKLNPYTKISIEQFIEGKNDFEGMYKRALADYQNLIKRTDIEKQEFVKYANERLLTEILPVYDNLKTSFKHIGDGAESNSWLEGIKYVIKQFGDVLNGLGVEEIKTVGEKFDHHTMEAIEKKETDDKKKDGIVESEAMPGYRLGDKVIRAARVVVYELSINN